MSDPISATSQGFVTFHAWTKSHNIGHFSCTYGEKRGGETLWQNHLSIHPKHGWLANPLVFLTTISLKARHVSSLIEDCSLESADGKKPRLPDWQYTFPATQGQIAAIDSYAENSKKQIELGLQRYTYLPKIPVATWLLQGLAKKSAVQELAKDPISELPIEFAEPSEWALLQNITHSHCVVQARDVASLLHLPLTPERPLYVGTPRQFNKELAEIAQKTPGATTVKTDHIPSDEEGLSQVPI